MVCSALSSIEGLRQARLCFLLISTKIPLWKFLWPKATLFLMKSWRKSLLVWSNGTQRFFQRLPNLEKSTKCTFWTILETIFQGTYLLSLSPKRTLRTSSGISPEDATEGSSCCPSSLPCLISRRAAAGSFTKGPAEEGETAIFSI